MNEPNTSSPHSSGAAIAVGIVAAFISLAAWPFGFLLFGMGAGFADQGLSQSMAEGWNEGGWWMYLLALIEMLFVLSGAVALFLVARGRAMAWAVVPVLAFAMLGVGVFGFRSGLDGSVMAVAHANPLDRGIIMYGATGESLQSIHLAVCFIAATFLLHAFCLALIGFFAREKKPVLLFALGVFSLGVWQLASARVTSMELGSYKAMAHSAPSDRATIVVATLMEGQSAQRLGVGGALLLMLVVVVLALALLRSMPRARAGVVSTVLVTLAGLGGLRALGKPHADAQLLMKGAQAEMLPLRASSAELPYPFIALGTTLHDAEGRTPRIEEVLLGRTEASLVLEPNVTLEALISTLRQFRASGAREMRLIGERRVEPPPEVTIPPILDPIFHQPASVRLELLAECPERGCATVDAKGLSWDGERYDFVESSSAIPIEGVGRGVPLDPKSFVTLAQLLECAKATDAKGLPLALVVGE